MTVQAVLFDFGGVIAEEGFRDCLLTLADEQDLDGEWLVQQGMQAVYDCGFVLGSGTEAQFWQLMRLRTGLAGEDRELTDRVLSGFKVRAWMLELVRKLRARGYVTAILSDQTHWLDTLELQQHFMGEFDHIYNSYHLGKGKRDTTLFSDIANTLQMSPACLLFIDDNAGNVQRARQAGMRTILYQHRAQFIKELGEQLPDVI